MNSYSPTATQQGAAPDRLQLRLSLVPRFSLRFRRRVSLVVLLLARGSDSSVILSFIMARKNTLPCQCKFIAEMLSDPDSGLSVTEDGIYITEDFWVLYYCPHCKGLMPNIWNARITDEERERLQQIIDGITAAEEAIEQLGPPDYDVFMSHWDSIGGKLVYNEELSQKTRNIEYYHLSECANLEFYFDKDSGREGRIILKPTEAQLRHLAPEPYCDGTDNGKEPMQVSLYEINWVKCPNCSWRFCLDYATQSGQWPVHPKCGQRLKVETT